MGPPAVTVDNAEYTDASLHKRIPTSRTLWITRVDNRAGRSGSAGIIATRSRAAGDTREKVVR